MRTAVEQVTGWVVRSTPLKKVKCHICETPIAAHTKVFRYTTGFYRGHERTAFICIGCARGLLEAMIADATRLLSRIPDPATWESLGCGLDAAPEPDQTYGADS